jgi:dTDP-4-dehydrorhamnose 3,5-epimerase
MKIISTDFEGLFLVQFHSVIDSRGMFMKPWVKEVLEPSFGVNHETYFSSSEKGTVRGLHYQKGKFAQNKFVVCLGGSIEDFATDLRPESETYGKTFRISLSPDSCGVIVPKGFAHGIFANSDCIITNFCSAPYNPESELGINWSSIDILDDLKVKIESDKDRNLPSLESIL